MGGPQAVRSNSVVQATQRAHRAPSSTPSAPHTGEQHIRLPTATLSSPSPGVTLSPRLISRPFPLSSPAHCQPAATAVHEPRPFKVNMPHQLSFRIHTPLSPPFRGVPLKRRSAGRWRRNPTDQQHVLKRGRKGEPHRPGLPLPARKVAGDK